MPIQSSGPSRPSVEIAAPARSSQSVSKVSDETPSTEQHAPAAARPRDVLDLSPAARAFVARADGEGALSAERLMEIRQRVLDGTYDSPQILDAVALKLRSSGDLR